MGKLVYKTVIPLNPKTKKNNPRIGYNRKTGKPFVMPSEEYETYERDAGWYIRRPAKPIDFPVNVKCLFYRKNEVRVDLTNLEEAIDDILVNMGVLKDDNFKILVGHDGSRVYVDPQNPRTEIYITILDE